MPKKSLEDEDIIYDGRLAETVVNGVSYDPRIYDGIDDVATRQIGNYTNFTGQETIKPSKERYIEEQRNIARINAINSILHQSSPNVPVIPKRNVLSILAARLGMSDKNRIKLFGKESNNKISTCIYTVTNQYGDPTSVIASNKNFRKSPKKYGFVQIPNNKIQNGDIVQWLTSTGDYPHHAVMYTGKSDSGNALISYSNGSVEPYEDIEGTKIDNIRRDVTFGVNPTEYQREKYATYRYIGSKQQNRKWNRQYNRLYRKSLKD